MKKETTYRAKRYKQKIDLIDERLEDAKTLVSDFSDKIKRLACYKAFQESVEGLFDIIAMTLKDKDKAIEDDYTNINKLEEMSVIDSKDAKILREANGLRNRVIHKYNKTDDNTAKESIRNLLPHLKEISEKLKGNINEKSQPYKED